MTFSIIAQCPKTKSLGFAICSAVPSVGEYFAFSETGVGVVAAQGAMNSYNGYKALRYMRDGCELEDIFQRLALEDSEINTRQIAMIDNNGNTFCHTGSWLSGLGVASHYLGERYVIAGNMLVDAETIEEMKLSMEKTKNLPLYERLLLALEAGDKTGGDYRGRQSAALKIHDLEDYPSISIRIDDSSDPVKELREKTDKFIKSFYILMPLFPKKDGTVAEKDDLKFMNTLAQFRKKVSERNF